jgi:hypothetical protein
VGRTGSRREVGFGAAVALLVLATIAATLVVFATLAGAAERERFEVLAVDESFRDTPPLHTGHMSLLDAPARRPERSTLS